MTNTGSITASGGAIGLTIGALVNSGAIEGAAASALILQTGGTLTNEISGTIGGGIQFAGGAGTVSNAGSMAAVLLAAGFSNLVTFDPGAVFNGTVDGGNTIGAPTVSELELAAGAGSGTLSGLGSQFINFGSITFDTGANWFIEGNTSGLAGTISGFAPGDTIEVDGITVTGSSYAGGVLTLTDNGPVVANLDLPGVNGEFQMTNVAGGTEISLVQSQPRTLSWAGSGNNSAFGSAANWDDLTNGLNPASTGPDPTDTVVFNSNGAPVSGTGTVNTMLFAGGGAWHLVAGTSLTATGAEDVGTNQSADLLINGGATLIGGGTATIANTTSASGSSVNVTGGNFQIAGTLVDGNAGAGLLDIGPGGAVSALELDLGSAAGGAGVLAIDGPGASLNATNSLVVGAAGVGELSILDNASVTIGGDLNIGVGAGASGNVDIENTTGTTTINGGITLGAGGGVAVLTIGTLTDVVLNGGLCIGKHANLVKHTNFDPPPYLSNAGGDDEGSGVDSYKAYVQNTGAITQDQGGTLVLQTPTVYGAGGSFQINTGGSELQVNADGVSGQVFDFTDNTGTLVIGIDQLTTIDTPSSGTGPSTAEKNPNLGQLLIGGFGGTIAGMVAGDAVVVDTTAAAHISYAGGSSVVSVIDNAAGTQVGTLAFNSAALAAQIGIGSVSAKQLELVACFAAGTRIGTDRGPVTVESLQVGDAVTLAGGGARAAVWIGSRTIDCARHPRPETVWPVCVARGAFGGNVPERDLYLSPDHAVFVEGVLIPVKLLINVMSITQVKRERVSYYHVELPEHAVILAEGLQVESYLDAGDRANFAGGDTIRLFPDFAASLHPDTALLWETKGAAPLVMTGSGMDNVRRMVMDIAPRQPGPVRRSVAS